MNLARRLTLNFQSHQIKVKTDHPIRQVFQKLELAGKMVTWFMELSEFGLKFRSQEPIKAQCLLDLMSKLPPKSSNSDGGD